MSIPAAPHRSPAEQARCDAALIELVEREIPFNQVLGLKVQSLRPAFEVLLTMRPELAGHLGRLHGGVTSAALDVMGSLALMVAIGEKHADETTEQVLHRFARMGTIDLRVDYLRPGIGHSFEASAEVTRLGGRIGSTQMRLLNDQGSLIATAAAAYTVS